MGTDTSTAPRIPLKLEPETMTALTLRYVEDNEEAADQYLRAMLRLFMFDLHPDEGFQLVHDFAAESTNDIRNFEGAEADADSRALPHRFVRLH